MKKKYLLLILLLMTYINVGAVELCTPSEEYLEYDKLPEEEKSKYIKPTYCKEVLDNQENQSILKKKIYPKVYKSILDTKYNSYTDGYTTSPKNQYQTGLCWDFSAISAVEANAKLKGLGNFDLSEAHLAYSILADVYSDAAGRKGKYNSSVETGGYITYAPSYFFGEYGQLSENDLSFESVLTSNKQNFKKIASSNYLKGKNLLLVNNFYENNYHSSGACSESDITTIKSNILKYGSSQSMMYMNQNLFSDSGNNYYLSTLNNSTYSNHAVAIVGWDDTVSKNKFTGATQNGAWIAKNSWGSSWSDDGFFYISYDDQFICSKTANYETSKIENYDHTYKSSELVGYQQLKLSNTFYIASKFKKDSLEDIDELVDRISFAIGEKMTYKVYLSKDNTINDKTNWIELENNSSYLYGITSIYPENIMIDDDFTIIIEYKVTNGEYSSIYTVCDNDSDYDYLTFNAGENYISFSGINNWTDMTNIQIQGQSYSIKCKPTMYVYTKNIGPSIEFTNILSEADKTTLTISTTSIDTSKITYKIYNSNNTDVTSNFKITPNYEKNTITITGSTIQSGSYTLSVNYDNEKEHINKTTPFQFTQSKIELNENEVTIQKGDTKNLVAIITPSSYKDRTVTWTSSNTKVATVANGKVTAIGVGKTIITATMNNGKKAQCNVEVREKIPKVAYTTHVQYIGWQKYVKDGVMAGTSGKSLRLEAIRIKLEDQDYSGNILYKTHIENIGWEKEYKKNGEDSGTNGKGLRLEAIEIKLDGEMANHYDVYYRVHAEQFGWLGWAKNGESSGTAGYAFRLEGIEIKLIEKGTTFSEYGKLVSFKDKNEATAITLNKKSVKVEVGEIETLTSTITPSNATNKDIVWTSSNESIVTVVNGVITGIGLGNATISATTMNGKTATCNVTVTSATSGVAYTTHVQNIGWQDYVSNGKMAGTSGKSLRLEGIKIKLKNLPYNGDIEYTTHVQYIGWQKYVSNGEMAGTSGKGLRLEGIRIRLIGEVSGYYDVYYRVHAENFGWLGWAKNGEDAGTAGYSYRLEGINIKLIPKGEKFSEYGEKDAFKQKG